MNLNRRGQRLCVGLLAQPVTPVANTRQPTTDTSGVTCSCQQSMPQGTETCTALCVAFVSPYRVAYVPQVFEIPVFHSSVQCVL